MKPIYLVITPYFPTPESWRGPFCYDFVKALIRTGEYDVRVMMPGDEGDYEYHGVPVLRFRCRELPWRALPSFFERENCRAFIEKLRTAGIRAEEIAVCHSHEIFCLPMANAIKRLNQKIKVVHHFHAMGHPFHVAMPRFGIVPIYSTLQYCYWRKHLEKIDLPVFVSHRQREMFGRWYPNGFLGATEDVRRRLTFGCLLRAVELKPSTVLYNGIDYSVFNDADRKPRADGAFVIGDVANFGEGKDQLTLLRALKRLKEGARLARHIRCRLVGSGPMLDTCRRYVGEHGLGEIVEFITEMDHLKLPEFYRSLDLFVSPSWAEGFGCTFVEAHGCGTPIVGCEGVSVDEVFSPDEQKKWLFKPQDDEALAKILVECINGRARLEQHFVDRFDINELVGKFLKKLDAL